MIAVLSDYYCRSLQLACPQVKSIVVNAPGYKENCGHGKEIDRVIKIWVKKVLTNKIRRPLEPIE
jgi:hypothetical protein